MNVSLPTLLQAAQEAYASGATKPAIETDSFIDEHEKAFHAHLYSHFSLDEQSLLTRITLLRSQGLTLARKGDAQGAEQFLQDAYLLLDSETFSPAAALFASSLHEAAMAYLDYKRNNFDIAEARVYKALTIDQTLEDEYGLNYLHLHRIRLLLNLIRIYRFSGQQELAIQMSFALLNYLEGKPASLAVPSTWDSTRIVLFPSAVRDTFFMRTSMELAFMVTGYDIPTLPDLFAAADDHLQANHSACCSLSRQSHDWLYLKQTLLKHDLSAFFSAAIPFLSQGRCTIPVLWYAVLIDLVILSRELEGSEDTAFRQSISKDAPSWSAWQMFPPPWKNLLTANI